MPCPCNHMETICKSGALAAIWIAGKPAPTGHESMWERRHRRDEPTAAIGFRWLG